MALYGLLRKSLIRQSMHFIRRGKTMLISAGAGLQPGPLINGMISMERIKNITKIRKGSGF